MNWHGRNMYRKAKLMFQKGAPIIWKHEKEKDVEIKNWKFDDFCVTIAFVLINFSYQISIIAGGWIRTRLARSMVIESGKQWDGQGGLTLIGSRFLVTWSISMRSLQAGLGPTMASLCWFISHATPPQTLGLQLVASEPGYTKTRDGLTSLTYQ